MTKNKTWTREEIQKLIGEALEETNEVLNKTKPNPEEIKEGEEGETLHSLLVYLQNQLLLISFAECLKSKLR